ncbi:hypothetical protein DMP17_45010 [Pseudonocardia sp. TMWB2A]
MNLSDIFERLNLRDLLRAWPLLLVFGITFVAVLYLNPAKAGLAIWGVSKLALGAYVGYWADRLTFRPEDRPHLLTGIERGTAWKRRAWIGLRMHHRGGVAAMRILALVLMLLFAGTAGAQIPETSARYRLKLEQEANRYFGLAAPISALAAQVHQESTWNPKAQSPYAMGLTQFTPSTAKWIPSVCPLIGPPDVWDPNWSLAAHACYMAWLYKRVPRYAKPTPPLSTCDRFAFALRAYNGGEGWVNRERKLAFDKGANANNWKAVAPYRLRATWAHTENIGYPQRILNVLEPRYYNAGWDRLLACP